MKKDEQPNEEAFGGFTYREWDRMVKSLGSNRVTVKRLVLQLGL